MARGKKRMWAGVTLVGLGVLAGGMVIASRWRGLSWGETTPSRSWEFNMGAGEIELIDVSERTAYPWDRYGWDFQTWRTEPAEGPDVVLRPRTIMVHQPGESFDIENQPVYVGPLLAMSRTDDWERVRIAFVAWPIPVFILIAGALPLWSGWRVRRRSRTGGCLGCGYDLSATPGPAPCPECGAQRAESETGRSMRNTPRTS